MTEILLGSHVGMSGKEMFLGSVKEAAEYGANALMVYTGAPQNTRTTPSRSLTQQATGTAAGIFLKCRCGRSCGADRKGTEPGA